MSIYEHAVRFAGKQVVDFQGEPLPDPDTHVPALRVEYDDPQTANDLLAQLLEDPAADRLTGLVVGAWAGELYDASAAAVVEALVAAASLLPSLRALFLGDIISEESEISWIQQTDVSPLWTAFPRLEIIRIRGSVGLSLGRPELGHLRELAIECGGLPKAVLHSLATSKLPALKHLELYLGEEQYGWDGALDDIKPLLEANRFPQLDYLGLRDSEICDEVAALVAQSPIVEQLKVLDLSLGTLTDAGANALLQCPAIRNLEKLDLHHHYLSASVVQQLEKLGITVDVSDPQQVEEYNGETYRYVAVGE